jgi:hypothetical protein
VYFLEGACGSGLELPADGDGDGLRAMVCEVAVGRALVAPASAGAAADSTFRTVSPQAVARAGFDSIRVYDSEDGRGPQYMHVVQHPGQAVPRYVVTFAVAAAAHPPRPSSAARLRAPEVSAAAAPAAPLEHARSSPHPRPHPHPHGGGGGGGGADSASPHARRRQLLAAEEAARLRAEDAARRARQLEAELEGVYRAERAAELEAAAGRAQARF